jgi:large subunit ribosomal protein L9
MEVILLEKVENLGNIGDLVKVRSGYGRNFLLPKGKATLATSENIAVFEARRAELEQRQADDLGLAQKRAEQLQGLSIAINARAGLEGKLFGSVGTVDIAEACTTAGVEIQRSEVRLPDGPLRMIGEHAVEFHLHTDVNTTITIAVIDDGKGEAPIDVDAEDAAAAAAEDSASVDTPAAD